MANPKGASPRSRGSRNSGAPPLGAARNKHKHRLAATLRHHHESLRQSLAHLFSEPVHSTMTALVIGIALALPAGLYTIIVSLQQIGGDIEASTRITVFLHHEIDAKEIEATRNRWSSDPQVFKLEYIAADQALAEFKTQSGFGDILDLLDENPLPPVLLVTPDIKMDVEHIPRLAGRLEADPTVDAAQLDMLWLERLNAILLTGRQVIFALTGVLALGVLLIIGNTIRLEVENRREEILVTKLVGGTNAFVRRPFLYSGLCYGFSGAVFSWLAVMFGNWWLNTSVERLAKLYQSQLTLLNPGFLELGFLLGGGSLLGILGARLIVERHIAAIEP